MHLTRRGNTAGFVDNYPARQRCERDPQLREGPQGGPVVGSGEVLTPID